MSSTRLLEKAGTAIIRTAPTAGGAFSIAVTAPCNALTASSSSLSINTINLPRARRTPALRAAFWPRLRSRRANTIRGSPMPRTTDGVRSVDASSTTIHSNGTDSPRMLRHSRGSKAARSKVGVTIKITGGGMDLSVRPVLASERGICLSFQTVQVPSQVGCLPGGMGDVRAERGCGQAGGQMRWNRIVATGQEHGRPHGAKRTIDPDGSGAQDGGPHHSVEAGDDGCRGGQNQHRPTFLKVASVQAHDMRGSQRHRRRDGGRDRGRKSEVPSQSLFVTRQVLLAVEIGQQRQRKLRQHERREQNGALPLICGAEQSHFRVAAGPIDEHGISRPGGGPHQRSTQKRRYGEGPQRPAFCQRAGKTRTNSESRALASERNLAHQTCGRRRNRQRPDGAGQTPEKYAGDGHGKCDQPPRQVDAGNGPEGLKPR